MKEHRVHVKMSLKHKNPYILNLIPIFSENNTQTEVKCHNNDAKSHKSGPYTKVNV